ncbi:SdpA family antimicrobial peptide system protein [Rhodococcus sp. WS4]|nr:SdpA family antimicrobial peptide system protein [Rhodococcus sp. WS4]
MPRTGSGEAIPLPPAVSPRKRPSPTWRERSLREPRATSVRNVNEFWRRATLVLGREPGTREHGAAVADSKRPVPVWIFAAVSAPVLVLAAYVALLQVPKTALELPLQKSDGTRALTQIAPQGWAFFTRSPRGETIRIFRRDGHGVAEASSMPIAAPRNWFGLDRLPRAQGTEYATLLAAQPEDGWVECDGVDSCLSDGMPIHPVESPVPNPSFCGDIYAVGYGVTPWAWREFDYEPRPAERAIRMDVSC